MAQIDDLNTAVANLQAAVAALPSRIPAPAPSLVSATSAVQAAADTLNAIDPAAPTVKLAAFVAS